MIIRRGRLLSTLKYCCFQVLSLMDDDKDGVIQVDHVMKVIELLGTTHAKLPAKQIRQIVDMLAKEEMLEMEDNIEEDMDKALRGKFPIMRQQPSIC